MEHEKISYYVHEGMTEVWKIMDELMDTLQVIQPRLYNSVIRKIDSI